jgi:ELWxxDGT repeat protein
MGDNQLWRSDGTAGGTRMLQGVNLPSDALVFNTDPIVNFNGTLFFAAYSGSNMVAWRSDGTEAGTTVFASDYHNPDYFTVVNDRLFFVADVNIFGVQPLGVELVFTRDGVNSRIYDVNPGANSSYPGFLTVMGTTLFFAANDGTRGTELWEVESEAQDVTLVEDIRPGTIGSYPRYMANVNGTLFFAATAGSSRELWRTNGTSGGTAPLFGFASGPYMLTDVDGTLFFVADDGTGSGSELWRSGGTSGSTFPVADINAEGTATFKNLTNLNGSLFFDADDGIHGLELWVSNGTAAGTKLVRDFHPGPEGGEQNAPEMLNLNGRLLLSAEDGMHGYEPWVLSVSPAAANASANMPVSETPAAQLDRLYAAFFSAANTFGSPDELTKSVPARRSLLRIQIGSCDPSLSPIGGSPESIWRMPVLAEARLAGPFNDRRF